MEGHRNRRRLLAAWSVAESRQEAANARRGGGGQQVDRPDPEVPEKATRRRWPLIVVRSRGLPRIFFIGCAVGSYIELAGIVLTCFWPYLFNASRLSATQSTIVPTDSVPIPVSLYLMHFVSMPPPDDLIGGPEACFFVLACGLTLTALVFGTTGAFGYHCVARMGRDRRATQSPKRG